MTTNLVIVGILMVLSVGLATAVLDADADGAFMDDATPTATATSRPANTPTPEPTATPTPVRNREDCEEIRGTDYLSPGERQWFLANCVSS